MESCSKIVFGLWSDARKITWLWLIRSEFWMKRFGQLSGKSFHSISPSSIGWSLLNARTSSASPCISRAWKRIVGKPSHKRCACCWWAVNVTIVFPSRSRPVFVLLSAMRTTSDRIHSINWLPTPVLWWSLSTQHSSPSPDVASIQNEPARYWFKKTSTGADRS